MCSEKKKNLLIWKIKLIYTLLIRCKFMCCSKHFTIYLLSLQNTLFFDLHRASYVIMLFCLSTYSIEIHFCTRLRLIPSPGCHYEKLSSFHVCIFQLILLTKMQFLFGSLWLLHYSWFFFSCKLFLLSVNNISGIHGLKNAFVICFFLLPFFVDFINFGEFYVCISFGNWLESPYI